MSHFPHVTISHFPHVTSEFEHSTANLNVLCKVGARGVWGGGGLGVSAQTRFFAFVPFCVYIHSFLIYLFIYLSSLGAEIQAPVIVLSRPPSRPPSLSPALHPSLPPSRPHSFHPSRPPSRPPSLHPSGWLFRISLVWILSLPPSLSRLYLSVISPSLPPTLPPSPSLSFSLFLSVADWFISLWFRSHTSAFYDF